MKAKSKLFFLLGIIIVISMVSIAPIIASVPSKYGKIGVSSAQMKNLTQTVIVGGVVVPDKKQLIHLNPAQNLGKVFVHEGQDVKKGDLILEVNGSEDLKSKENTVFRADIDGRVVKLDLNQDIYSSQETSQILIYDMSEYVVNAQLKQQEAIYIEKGMKAKIKIKGLEEKEYNGTVLNVDEIATSSSNEGSTPEVDIKIRIDDPDERIRMGYESEVKIDLHIKQDAVVVDFESIIQDRDGTKYIYFVENDMARKKVVSTGIGTSFEVEITEGIIEGDRYVVNPPEEMQSKESMKIGGWRYESR